MINSADKWPVVIRVSSLTVSEVNNALSTLLIVGVMNGTQLESMDIRMGIHTVMEIGEAQYVMVGVVTQYQLDDLYKIFEPLSRSWRGQYQVLAKEFVRAVQERT